MRTLKTAFLASALGLISASPAWADLTLSASGTYNLGSASGPGGTVAPSSACGSNGGQDAGQFDDAGANGIGIHAYACDSGQINFGSRASGQNTYYAKGIASVIGQYTIADAGAFSFFINPGQVGAFGNAAFAAGEFEKAQLNVQLVIDGTTYLDEAWSAEVGAGGLITNSYTHLGQDSIGYSSTSGAGYYSYGIAGGFYSVDLDAGTHDISYIMTSMSAGNITSTVSCTAVLYGGGVAARGGAQGDVVAAGPIPGDPFSSFCGAGAQSGDPFPPIATPYDGSLDPAALPEPMSAALVLTALLAAAGVRRRRR